MDDLLNPILGHTSWASSSRVLQNCVDLCGEGASTRLRNKRWAPMALSVAAALPIAEARASVVAEGGAK